FESLRKDLLEECYETIDAVNKKDDASLREELGDVLLSVMLYAKIAENNGLFTIGDVISGITEKIIRRHSHVFGNVRAKTPEESMENWEAEKTLEKGYKTITEKLRDVPAAMPALMRTQKLLEKSASGNGTDCVSELLTDFIETAGRLEEAFECRKTGMDSHLGLMMLQITEISRIFEINAELALTNVLEKFINPDFITQKKETTPQEGSAPMIAELKTKKAKQKYKRNVAN
ncbi:MAG: MazG family protein, partial [Firmicutes bacterium]|nr:MazG family protein [Bacillota bacterium]